MEDLEDKIGEEFEKYLDLYTDEMMKWNEKVKKDGGGYEWGDFNSPPVSYETFRAAYLGKDHVPVIIKDDGDIITKIDGDEGVFN